MPVGRLSARCPSNVSHLCHFMSRTSGSCQIRIIHLKMHMWTDSRDTGNGLKSDGLNQVAWGICLTRWSTVQCSKSVSEGNKLKLKHLERALTVTHVCLWLDSLMFSSKFFLAKECCCYVLFFTNFDLQLLQCPNRRGCLTLVCLQAGVWHLRTWKWRVSDLSQRAGSTRTSERDWAFHRRSAEGTKNMNYLERTS